jgi:hypothetical protein
MLQVKQTEGIVDSAFLDQVRRVRLRCAKLAGWQVGGRHRFDLSFILHGSAKLVDDLNKLRKLWILRNNQRKTSLRG